MRVFVKILSPRRLTFLILPLVSTFHLPSCRGVAYGRLTPLLVGAVQALAAEVDALHATNANLQARIDKFEREGLEERLPSPKQLSNPSGSVGHQQEVLGGESTGPAASEPAAEARAMAAEQVAARAMAAVEAMAERLDALEAKLALQI